MKIYQALKVKNKLIGEITQLQHIIQSKNSRIVGETNLFDLDEVLKELETKKSNLIELKSAITAANAPVQSKIYQLSELKASVKFWAGVPTRDGKETDRYSREVNEYASHFNEVKVMDTRKSYEKQIEKLQEELDSFNHATSIPTLTFSVEE